MRTLRLVTLALTLAVPLAAQAFNPPRGGPARSGGTQIGLLGFSVRAGVDVAGNGQFVAAVALDIGNVGLERVRLRPAAEIGILNGANTYAASFDVLYRFADDKQAVTPYAGAGFSIVGHESCGADPDCPDVWANVVVGFELHYRSTFNWLLEYHGMAGFRHNRLYAGLTTRRGN